MDDRTTGIREKGGQIRRFGPFVLDIQGNELRRNDVRVRLQPQTLRLLLLLTASGGELVTREQLRQTLWDEGVFVEFEQALNFTVSQLRTALRDSAAKPRYIETVPRRGYRFIEPIEVEVIDSPEPARASTEMETVTPAAIGTQPEHRRAIVDLLPTGDPAGTGNHEGRSTQLPRYRFAVLAMVLLGVVAFLVRREVQLRRSKELQQASIVVLPFLNLTGDPNKAYISDGIMEEIITRLATTGGDRLRVIARTSAVSFRDKSFTVGQIANDLRAEYVLEGSLQGSGNHVRVIAQLIRSSDQTHLWANAYEGDASQLQDFEAAISDTTLTELLGKAAPANIKSHIAANAGGHDAYLKGLSLLAQRSRDGFEGALQNFGQAIQADPKNADAYAELAVTYNLMGQYDMMRQDMARSQGKAAALQALAIDPSLVEAHAALAFSNWFYGWDIPAAEKELSAAVAVQPNNVDAHHWYAMALMSDGRFAEADRQFDAAILLDPHSLILQTNLGWLHYMMGDFPLAAKEMNAVLSQNPNFLTAHYKLWYDDSMMGDQDEAFVHFQKLSQFNLSADLYRRILNAHKRGGYKAALLTLAQDDDGPYGDEGDRARAYIFAGKRTEAVKALQAGVQAHDGWMIFVPVDPAFVALRSDPVYAELSARIHDTGRVRRETR